VKCEGGEGGDNIYRKKRKVKELKENSNIVKMKLTLSWKKKTKMFWIKKSEERGEGTQTNVETRRKETKRSKR
jgi:hypothetical protein